MCGTETATWGIVKAGTAEAEIVMAVAAVVAAGIASLTAAEKEKMFSEPTSVRLNVCFLDL